MTPRHHIISTTVIILEEKDGLKKIFSKKLCKKNQKFLGSPLYVGDRILIKLFINICSVSGLLLKVDGPSNVNDVGQEVEGHLTESERTPLDRTLSLGPPKVESVHFHLKSVSPKFLIKIKNGSRKRKTNFSKIQFEQYYEQSDVRVGQSDKSQDIYIGKTIAKRRKKGIQKNLKFQL